MELRADLVLTVELRQCIRGRERETLISLLARDLQEPEKATEAALSMRTECLEQQREKIEGEERGEPGISGQTGSVVSKGWKGQLIGGQDLGRIFIHSCQGHWCS